MKKLMFLMMLMLLSTTLFAGVKEKALEVPNATASLINKAAVGTNNNATALVGGANQTAHNIASDLNDFGKSIYHFLTGQEVK